MLAPGSSPDAIFVVGSVKGQRLAELGRTPVVVGGGLDERTSGVRVPLTGERVDLAEGAEAEDHGRVRCEQSGICCSSAFSTLLAAPAISWTAGTSEQPAQHHQWERVRSRPWPSPPSGEAWSRSGG